MLPQQPRRSTRKQARNQLQAIRTDSSKRFCSDNKSGEFELPLALLEKVMSCLAVMEADGVRGPSMAARDLAHAALVSWEFYNASKHGFAVSEGQAAELKLRKQQLQGLHFLALQKDDFSEWLRKDVRKAVEKQRKQMQVLVEVMPQFFQNIRAMIQQQEQQQELMDTAMQQVQKLEDVFDTLQQLLHEVPQRVARMRKQHKELPRMTGKQLQPLLEQICREPKELRERMQQVQQMVDELASMQEALCQRYAC
ncbi:hypothetical protein OEZ85_013384 [Tetradesmus obliquus]|uniref:Uncharacterized protein n=1 Tax=Tetradesmus obliquus TaxID=3088 RepID=A0ABY8U693_TETOB|nr:hypothetical protein OEZ85_013384 [Tetradesmus obliquus]